MNKSDLEQAQEHTTTALNKAQKADLPTKITEQVVLGFDGYKDDIVSVVRFRSSPTDLELMENISEWADRIAQAAGSSASIETVIKKISAGGFTCNVGKAISKLCGFTENTHLIGAFGLPKLQNIFQEQLVDQHHCITFPVSNPGTTVCYEFQDGKIMIVDNDNINHLNWNQIISILGQEFIINEYEKSSLWGIGYWASNPNMSQIFSELQSSILPSLSESSRKKFLILDLSDLSRKSREQWKELATLLPGFEDYVQVVLLLNDLELKVLSEELVGKSSQSHLNLTESLQHILNLSYVISHTPKMAHLASKNKLITILNAYTSTPRFTTAAGDHFSAGISYGLLANISAEVLPLIGNCVASIFVREGISPIPQDVQQFLINYSKYLENIY